MCIVYFSEIMLPGQDDTSRARAAFRQAERNPVPAQSRNGRPARQQALDQELRARQELTPKRGRPAPEPSLPPLSVAEITRDLAGWTTPQAGAPRASKR